MLAPLTYILLDVKIFVSNVDEAIAYTATYMVVNVMVQNYLFGIVRWPWVSELYEYCQGVYLSRAIVTVILNPRKPTFNVTAKGLTLDNDHLSELSGPYFVIFGLLLAGSAVAAYRYMFEPGISNLMFIVGLWNSFNLIMAGVALGAVAERKQPDRHPRLSIKRQGILDFDDELVPVRIENVSAGGCAVRLDGELPKALRDNDEAHARLLIEPIGDMTGNMTLPLIVRRAETAGAELYGCEFDVMQPEEYFVLADLMYGDSDALPTFLAGRRKHKSVWTGTAQVIWWGMVEPLRAFSYLLKRKAPVESAPEAAPEASTEWLHRLAAKARGEAPPESIAEKPQQTAASATSA
jgi:cellulose synthase (UDP-forming)